MNNYARDMGHVHSATNDGHAVCRFVAKMNSDLADRFVAAIRRRGGGGLAQVNLRNFLFNH